MNLPTLRRAGLEVLYYSGASRVLAPLCSGTGAIFMLHHVRPGIGAENRFAPNADLEVTPEFLNDVIEYVRDRGYELVSLEEARRRMVTGSFGRPFAAFTLDDGYRDNLDHALPVFRRHQCPFTVFVCTGLIDGNCELWWRGLEAAVAGTPEIAVELPGEGTVVLPAQTDAEKRAAFARLYWPLRTMPQHEQRIWIRALCDLHGIDLDAMCRAEAMTWDEVRKLSADPLCSIGGHTVRHFALSKLELEEAWREVVDSRRRLQEETGTLPTAFAYPYGDECSAGPRDFGLVRKAGYDMAVTTRKGLIYPPHREHLCALPRVSLNGSFQNLRYVEVLLSGTAFALFNGFRRVA